MVVPRKRHGIWWMSMPVPVAVALCVTCFFFGYFTHNVPRLGPSLQTQMLDASIRQKQQQKKPQQQQQQQHQQQQPALQSEVITPQQEQAEVALLKQQQQQQQEQEQQHQQAVTAEQQKKEQQSKEQRPTEQHHQSSEQQQQQKQQHETGVQQPQQQQQPEGSVHSPTVPQQPQPQSLPAEAQPQQPQPPQQQQQQGGAVSPAVDSVDAEQQAQECLQRAGLLQPLLPAAESGHNHYTVAAYQILSWQPRIVVYPNFIDRHKAAHIMNLAQQRVKRSEVKLRQGEDLDPTRNFRATAGVPLRREEDPDGVLGWLEDKIEAVTLIPSNHGEAFHALKYHLNEKTDSHMEMVDPEPNGAQKTVRLAKMIIYLSDVEEGGETVIKKDVLEGDLKKVSNYTTCEDGDYKYKPRLGDAVLFYSLDPDNTVNPRSLHGGCPVIKGTKWVVTKWLHNKPVQKGATR